MKIAHLKYVILSCSMSLFSQHADAQVLWQNVRFGMSPGEVRVAQPQAVAGSGEKLGSGSTCELSVPSYEVGSAIFRLCFYFVAHKLTEVQLEPVTPSEALFNKMSELLRARYGASLKDTEPPCQQFMEKQQLIMTGCERGWLLPSGTDISVLYIATPRTPPVLNITYSIKTKTDSSRL